MRLLRFTFAGERVQLSVIYTPDMAARLSDQPRLSYGLGRYPTGAVIWVRARLHDALVFDGALNPADEAHGHILAALTKEDQLDLLGLDSTSQPQLRWTAHNTPDAQRSLAAHMAEARAHNRRLEAVDFQASEQRLWADLAS